MTTRNRPETVAVEGEAEEEFYESLDRILSSSCSSTSASDDEADPRHHRNVLHRRSGGAARPHSFSDMYDVWIGDPGSVEERRRRLLQKLGLIGDPALARRRCAAGDDVEASSSAPAGAAAAIARSRSDGPRALPRPDESERLCTIRNLNSGEEFVVRELREDGMWKELREVGTGRNLTMEEFQISVVGQSPIVQELMRRHGGELCGGRRRGVDNAAPGEKARRKGSWFRSLRIRMEGRSSDERDTSSENGGGRRLSSVADDLHDTRLNHGPEAERVKVRQYGKSWKELSVLCLNQEIQAHCGAIWTMKFSLDGRYLASAGEDCVVRVWQVVESEAQRDCLMGDDGTGLLEKVDHANSVENGADGSAQMAAVQLNPGRESSEKRRRLKVPGSRKSFSLDAVAIPEFVFSLSEKPVRSFIGHQKDVIDLSWSKSERLLSSSMDKTVKLWDMNSNSCLKTFLHSDCVTCIQFNPVDENYFISGSLDAKVRLWSIEERQVVDWSDLHEMVTAACYTPDGQGALVGSHTGNCNFYNASGHKLQERNHVDLQNKKKKSHFKKITGFQFASVSSSELLVTSADSRIRVVDNLDLVHKFKGFRNTSSQISASITADGKHVICSSEDSHVYIWRYDADSRPNRSKGVTETQSYEYFHSRDVSVAVSWPRTSPCRNQRASTRDAITSPNNTRDAITVGAARQQPKSPFPVRGCNSSPRNPTHSAPTSSLFYDRVSATWPEEKLVSPSNKQSPRCGWELKNEALDRSAWGMVIVTASASGEIKAFQNFGFPVRS